MNISSGNIALQIAGLKSGIVSTLIDVLGSGKSSTANFAEILGTKTGEVAAGRNASLRDPEAAYKMMSKINAFEVGFKAQYAELTALSSALERMEAAGVALGEMEAGESNAAIRERLERFVTEYNDWEDRFDHTVEAGGVLDKVQAAEVALWSLEQSIRSIFHGANDDVGGLADLGISIDPATKQASLDPARLDAMIARDKPGAVNAIREFAAHFAGAADLLNAPDNFVPRALDNRSRAINFLTENGVSLRAEFGTGDAARPSGDTAKALAAYEAAFRV